MTTSQKTLIAATITVAAGTGIYEARQAARLRDQVHAPQQQQAPLTGQIEQMRRQRDDALGKLAALQQEIERLRRDTTELARLRGEVARQRNDAQELAQLKGADTDSANPAASEMKSWLSRVSQLKQHLERTPNQKIPELQFVTGQDWLDAARGDFETEADFRRAMSALRSAGERKFASTLLQPAVKQYMAASNGEFPTGLSQLQPYFKSPVEDAVLQRWEIVSAGGIKSIGLGGPRHITQKAPVDDVFDTRFGIGRDRFGSEDFLFSLTRDAMASVNEAYSAANNGKFPHDLAELLPYATTPEQQTAIQKVMQRKAFEKKHD